MTSRIKIRLIGLALFATAFNSQSPAAFTTLTTFVFHGNCSDCSGQGTATLVLGNYTPGTNFTSSNLFSFTYTSNLINFTLGPSAFASGLIPASLPAAANVNVSSNPCCSTQFSSFSNGTWCAGNSCDDDSGTGGVWALPASPTPTPTGAPALTGVGLSGLAVTIAVMGAILLKKRQATA